MATGFQDLFAWLLHWMSSAYSLGEILGPYRGAVGMVFISGSATSDVEHAGAARGIVSGGNVIAGICNG
jgi:hypothetical protein